MGREKRHLGGCYTVAKTEDDIQYFLKIRGNKWSMQYQTAEEAGIARYGLRFIPLNKIEPQFGDTLI